MGGCYASPARMVLAIIWGKEEATLYMATVNVKDAVRAAADYLKSIQI